MKERRPEPVDESDTGFWNRWSERKQAAREAEAAPPAPSEPATAAGEAPHPTDRDMPPLESLDETSDYRAFLSPEVSEGLRRLALRKLFHAEQFNACDGLDDYAEDFTAFEKLGDIVTADMRFQMEQEARRALAESEAGGEEQAPVDPAVAAREGAGDPEPSAEAGEPKIETPPRGDGEPDTGVGA